MSDLSKLWAMHRDADYPRMHGPNAGEFMTLDTVICGCVTHYLDSGHDLDPQRMEMLRDCLNDLNNLMPELNEAASAYFARLHHMATLLMDVYRH